METGPVFSFAHAWPSDLTVYAIGDVHGRDDLLARLLPMIEKDRALAPQRRALLVFLGDYVDRGLQSRQVIERLATQNFAGFETVFLRGNHEAAMLDFLRSPDEGAGWYAFGGTATLQSYGVPPRGGPGAFAETAQRLAAALPARHREFLGQSLLWHRVGDVVFVHAGIERGVPLSEQREEVLLWVREPFLSDPAADGLLVVHGHTITRAPEVRSNRVGIDTGAYATGKLTCLVLAEGQGRFLQS